MVPFPMLLARARKVRRKDKESRQKIPAASCSPAQKQAHQQNQGGKSIAVIMPKKSRRGRVKAKAAVSGNGAGPNSGVIDNDEAFNSMKMACWLYHWTPLKEALVEKFIGELASAHGVDRKFDRDNIPLPLRIMIENLVAAFQIESLGDDSCIGVPREVALPIGLQIIRQFYGDGFPSLRSSQQRAKFVEEILSLSDSLLSDGQDDTAAAVLAYGLRISKTKDFRSVFLVKWADHNVPEIDKSKIDESKKNPGAFRDENANRALRLVSNNEENAMHVRALAMTLRAFIVRDDWTSCPCPRAANFFRRALVYEENIQPGEISLPAKVTVRPFKRFTAETVKNALQLNTNCAKKSLLVYQGGSLIYDTNIFDRPLIFAPGGIYGEFQNYLTTGGSQCDHCGKTAEQAGLPCLHKCKQCRMAFYCSVECQAARWSGGGHREHCKKFARFNIGDKLVLFNLKKRSDLNASLVEVIGKTLPDRLNVRICYPPELEGTIVAAKKSNLRHHRPMK